MLFQNIVQTENITKWVASQIDATRSVTKYGWDITITPHKKSRTSQQNRFLMTVLNNIVLFSQRTGYVCPGLQQWAMQPSILKEYWKYRLGCLSTAKLSTAEFGQFIDQIQATMASETNGNYEIITPPDEYSQLINR